MINTPFTRQLMLTTALLAGPLAAFAETLKIATFAPEGSFWMTQMKEGASEIARRTDNRVQFRFYGGGVMGNDNQVRRKMRIGQLHGSTFTSGALGDFASEAEIYALPLTFRSLDEVRYVRARMDEKLRAALEKAGMVNFGIAGAGQGYLMSNVPVATPQDMRGQKTWVQEGDRIAYSAFEALGISPVAMPLTDVLTGLQTDLLDSAAVSPVGAIVFQLHTALRYITDLPLSYVYGALLIDQRAFGRLSAEDQAVVKEVMEAIYRRIDEASNQDHIEALAALQEAGLKRVEPDADAVPEWRARVAESNRALARSGEIPEALLDELLGHLEAFRNSGAP
ncbi:MAG: TRAP transporter substrate-binding protein DctP [Xanthomonadales bacterium]|nr:TRAP transporter substrate-binding protein DctP [Xanthomonadales bacterium]